MSRRIIARHLEYVSVDTIDYSAEYSEPANGKLLFTDYRHCPCAVLINNNRILAAQTISAEQGQIGAIYVAKIQNLNRNINAYFVALGHNEYGFLSERYIPPEIPELHQGDEILVQIVREPHDKKLACVSAKIEISNEVAAVRVGSGCISYSAKLSSSMKQRLKDQIHEWIADSRIFLPPTADLVLRTSAGQYSPELLLPKIAAILDEYNNLLNMAKHRTCFSCIREATPSFLDILDQNTIRPEEYSEIITEDTLLYRQLEGYCREHLPEKKVRLYQDDLLSLNKLYGVESKLKIAFERRVWLKSGGYLIFDTTEAMTVIDVNSGKSKGSKTKGSILSINREAAVEIILQLRLRNLSGIIIVDFINMCERKENIEFLEFLKELVKDDYRTRIIDMTGLGLVEMTRARNKKSLAEQFKQ